jgi:hypothetical protein
MPLSNIIALLASFAVAACTLIKRDSPSGSEVQIVNFTYTGSGCPAASAGGMLSDDPSTLLLWYDEFIVHTGIGIGSGASGESFQATVQLRLSQGWQFYLMAVQYRGHALIPTGSAGTCQSTYYFPGNPLQVRIARCISQGRYTLLNTKQSTTSVVIPSPTDLDFRLYGVFMTPNTVWSPCSTTVFLTINSTMQLSPPNSTQIAQLGVCSDR